MSGAEVAGKENVSATEPANSAVNRIFDRII
jgi:hypothetical protein